MIIYNSFEDIDCNLSYVGEKNSSPGRKVRYPKFENALLYNIRKNPLLSRQGILEEAKILKN